MKYKTIMKLLLHYLILFISVSLLFIQGFSYLRPGTRFWMKWFRIRRGLKQPVLVNIQYLLYTGNDLGIIVHPPRKILFFWLCAFPEGIKLFPLPKPDTNLDEILARDIRLTVLVPNGYIHDPKHIMCDIGWDAQINQIIDVCANKFLFLFSNGVAMSLLPTGMLVLCDSNEDDPPVCI